MRNAGRFDMPPRQIRRIHPIPPHVGREEFWRERNRKRERGDDTGLKCGTAAIGHLEGVFQARFLLIFAWANARREGLLVASRRHRLAEDSKRFALLPFDPGVGLQDFTGFRV